MFERFTNEARDVVVAAQIHARRLGHPRIGTSHLLLALIAEPGAAGTALRERGVTQESADAALAQLLASAGPPSTTDGVDAGARQDAPAGASPSTDDADALAALGIDLDRIRAAMEATFGPGALERAAGPRRRGPLARIGLGRRSGDRLGERAVLTSGARPSAGHIGFGPDARKALELSLREALRLGDGYIGSEHLLLGLLRRDCVAAGMLGGLDVDLAALRRSVERGRRRSA